MIIIREWDKKNKNDFAFNKNCLNKLEVGCGKGLFLSEISKNDTESYYYGIEIKHNCIIYALKKIMNNGNQNVTLINGDVFTALDKYFIDDSFDNIYVNFPDPWYKKRHIKKRVISPLMIDKYCRILKNNAILYFVTDNEEYRDYGIKSFLESDLFTPLFEFPYYKKQLECYPKSLYENKWRNDGKEIYYTAFLKK